MDNLIEKLQNAREDYKKRGIRHQFILDNVVELYEAIKDDNSEFNFFDIGCGHGCFSFYVNKFFDKKFNFFVLIDPFEKTKEYCNLYTTNDIKETIKLELKALDEQNKLVFYETTESVTDYFNQFDQNVKNIFCFDAFQIVSDMNALFKNKAVKVGDYLWINKINELELDFSEFVRFHATVINSQDDFIETDLATKSKYAQRKIFIKKLLEEKVLERINDTCFFFKKIPDEINIDNVRRVVDIKKAKKLFTPAYHKIRKEMIDVLNQILDFKL